MTMTPLTVRSGSLQEAGRRWWAAERVVVLIVWIVAVVAAAAAVTFVLAVRWSGLPMPEVYLENLAPALVMPAAGLLLVGRMRYRMVGWWFAVGGLCAGVAAFGFAFGAWAVQHPGLYGWAGAGVWGARWIWMAGTLAAPLVILVLPDGHEGWRRPVLIAACVAIGALAVVSAFSGSTATDPTTGRTVALPNPLALPALERLAWPVLVVAWAVLLAANAAGAVYLTWRWRRAVEREGQAWRCSPRPRGRWCCRGPTSPSWGCGWRCCSCRRSRSP